MALTPGMLLGPYKILGLAGAGGMGEVYRATDTRLGRTVAIKVLPAQVTHDRERRERFEREARIVASLNHPHICTLHDVGHEDGRHYLVMECLEGTTLQERLKRGRVPVREAVELSMQILDALDKAHRRGVVHRDLKPGNVMLTKSGVKLLDFGLAKQHPSSTRGNGDLETLGRSDDITAEGIVLGTLPFMAPELFEGKEGDARSDIFSFGALAYECITGRRAFRGDGHALIGAILRDEPPPIGELAPDAPPALSTAISRCLSKDPEDRWQTANDLLFHLRSMGSSAANDRPSRRARVAWVGAFCLGIVATWLAATALTDRLSNLPEQSSAIRFALTPPPGTAVYAGYDHPLALSPDGRQLVYVAVDSEGTKKLWRRPLDTELAQPIAGTEGASMPFWSPDSEWIAFFADHSLKKVAASGGSPQIIARGVSTFAGATWSVDDVILFPPAPTSGLSRVSARGGLVSQATTPGPTHGEAGQLWPQFLKDGEHFIYVSVTRPAGIQLARLGSDATRKLVDFPTPKVSSLAYAPGYVLFVQDAALFARPFDEDRLEFSGDSVRLVDGVPVTGAGRAPFTVSATGTLAYWTYPVGEPATLRWFERDGRTSTAVDTPIQYIGFSLAPDDRRLALSRADSDGGADIWLLDLARGGESRLTFGGVDFTPEFSPGGDRVAFAAARRGPPDLYVKRIDGSSEEQPLSSSPVPEFPSSWSRDARVLVYVSIDPVHRNDLWMVHAESGTHERLSLSTEFNETHGKLSPDGRSIAYVTDASGNDEVWVADFPSAGVRRQVSVGGGRWPQWDADGSEIFYISDDQQLMATTFTTASSGFDLGTPHPLFRIDDLVEMHPLVFPAAYVYAAATNTPRFLVATRARDPNAPPINVVLHWPALMRSSRSSVSSRLLPTR